MDRTPLPYVSALAKRLGLQDKEVHEGHVRFSAGWLKFLLFSRSNSQHGRGTCTSMQGQQHGNRTTSSVPLMRPVHTRTENMGS